MRRFVILALGLMLSWHSLVAETTFHGTLPIRRSGLGFSMDIHSEAVAGNGYLPMRLTFSPTGKSFMRDRNVSVRITPQQTHDGIFRYAYETAITLPQGSTSLDKHIYVPQYHDWSGIAVELREDGRQVKWGTSTFRNGNNLRYRFASQHVTVGIIGDRNAKVQDAEWKTYPDIRTLITVLGDGPIPDAPSLAGPTRPSPQRLSHQDSMKLAKQVQPAWVQFRPIDESGLPESWLGYSQLDVILVAKPIIDRIAKLQPERMEEVRKWLASGGNLWIYAASHGEGSFTESLNFDPVKPGKIVAARTVPRLLNLSSTNDGSPLVTDGWGNVTKQSMSYTYTNENQLANNRETVWANLKKIDHPFAGIEDPKRIATGLRTCSFGLGQIITIDAADPFPGSFQFWRSITNLRKPSDLNWATRHGVDVPKGNESYWNWLIGAVGQPPVKSFVLLNILFAILIGPICYRFLQLRGRLYLLYFVAPCVAVLVTGALFTYALLIDGVTTKQRTRQITWIDPIAKRQVSQTRSTYYRVLGYGQEVDVSRDTAIYPVRHSPMIRPFYVGTNGEPRLFGNYADAGDRQLLGAGFLPTRSQVQFVTVCPQASESAIDVDWESNMVTNGLSQRIQQLIVHDSDGKYWETSELNPLTSVKLEPCSDVNDRLKQILGTRALPEESEIPSLANYNWYGDVMVSHQSLLERRLKQWSLHLPKTSFVGTAEIDREQLGVTQAREVDSIHVIMGSLP